MQIHSFRASFSAHLTVGLLVLTALKPAVAEIAPAPLDDRFGWTRGDTNAHHVGWTSFQDELGTGAAFDFEPVVLDTTPDSLSAGSTGEIRETGSAGGFISSSGGIYSFSAALQFRNLLSGAGLDTGFTRVVAQVQTWGTEFDPTTLQLSSSTQTTPLAPQYVQELGRTVLGDAPQGDGDVIQVDTLLLWDLAGSDAAYTIGFSALGPHMTFKEFHGDVFSQSAAFVTPVAVPEPSGLLALGVSGVAALAVRRRKRV